MSWPNSQNQYDIGEEVRFSVAITDSGGDSLDPGGLTFAWRHEDATSPTTWTYGVDDEIERDGEGAYHVDLVIADSGLLYARWQSTGAGAGAVEWAVEGRRSNVLKT